MARPGLSFRRIERRHEPIPPIRTASDRSGRAVPRTPEGQAMLDDMNILIVEDEALIALDIAMTVEDEGATVVGPYGDVASALGRTHAADLAILDVDLCGEAVFPVADRLSADGKPFLFHTGRQDLSILRDRYGEDVQIVEKPASPDHLVTCLAKLLPVG